MTDRENITLVITEITALPETTDTDNDADSEDNTSAVEYDLDEYEAELVRYRKLRDSMKKANKKYRETHKNIVNQKQREYYAKKKEDNTYMERIRNASSKYYKNHKDEIKERREKKKQDIVQEPKEKIKKEKKSKKQVDQKTEHILMTI